jgi:uncharacterized protein YndB with AHSA1/START domain
MQQTLERPAVNTQTPKGVVQVRVTVPVVVERLWSALTKRELVCRWFGDLSEDLVPGAKVRLDFGDADFFAIDNISLSFPTRLTYGWSFLGTGPRDAISWQLDPQSDGCCVVTVTDSEPLRSGEAVSELREGWSDFLERLQRFLANGETSRYDWRRAFEGSIELPTPAKNAWRLLFARETLRKWFPFPIPGHCAGGPQEFSEESRAVQFQGEFELRCEVRESEWLNATCCHLHVESRDCGSILIVSHTGWEDISSNPSYCMSQRRAFGERWIHALQQAKQLVTTNASRVDGLRYIRS